MIFQLQPGGELHNWLKSLGVKDGEVHVADICSYTKTAILKFYLKEHFEVEYALNSDNARNIKIRHIETNLSDFIKFMERFGTVKNYFWDRNPSMDEAYLKNCLKQTLTLSMTITRNIPKSFIYNHIRIKTNYVGQPQTCGRCGEGNHQAKDCKAIKIRTYAIAMKFNQPAVGQEHFPVLNANNVRAHPVSPVVPVNERGVTPAKSVQTNSTKITKPILAQVGSESTPVESVQTVSAKSIEPDLAQVEPVFVELLTKNLTRNTTGPFFQVYIIFLNK